MSTSRKVVCLVQTMGGIDVEARSCRQLNSLETSGLCSISQSLVREFPVIFASSLQVASARLLCILMTALAKVSTAQHSSVCGPSGDFHCSCCTKVVLVQHQSRPETYCKVPSDRPL